MQPLSIGHWLHSCIIPMAYCIPIRMRRGIYGEIWPEPKGVPSGCTLGNSLGLRPYFAAYPSSCPNTDTVYPPEVQAPYCACVTCISPVPPGHRRLEHTGQPYKHYLSFLLDLRPFMHVPNACKQADRLLLAMCHVLTCSVLMEFNRNGIRDGLGKTLCVHISSVGSVPFSLLGSLLQSCFFVSFANLHPLSKALRVLTHGRLYTIFCRLLNGHFLDTKSVWLENSILCSFKVF